MVIARRTTHMTNEKYDEFRRSLPAATYVAQWAVRTSGKSAGCSAIGRWHNDEPASRLR
jgi:hypothetical protein